MPRTRRQTKTLKTNPKYINDSSSDDSDYCYGNFSLTKKDPVRRKNSQTRKSNETKSTKKKECDAPLLISESDDEDIDQNIKTAHEKAIENKLNSFFKDFDSDDNEPPSKKNDKDLYVLFSDSDCEVDVKPSTSASTSSFKLNTCTNSNKSVQKEVPVEKTKTENLYNFVDDILNQSDIIGMGVDKIKENISKTSFEDLMKKTNEIIGSVTNLLDDYNPKSKEPVNKTVEKEAPSCPVCLDSLGGETKAMVTICGHLFCEPCIIQVAKTVKKCPTCRKGVNKKKYHPIYI